MADGNFNRSHLPTNSYKSGHEAGAAQMRSRAIKALREIIESSEWEMKDFEVEKIMEDFRGKLE